MVPHKKRRRVIAVAHGIATHDLSKVLMLVVGLVGEHQYTKLANEAADAKHEADQMTAIGAVAAQVADERDTVAVLRLKVARLERLQARTLKKLHASEAFFTIGPVEPPKREGIISGVTHLLSAMFHRQKVD